MYNIYPNLPPGGIIVFHNTISQIEGKLFETTLKLKGEWESYTKDMFNQEIDNQIEEYKSFIEDKLLESNNS